MDKILGTNCAQAVRTSGKNTVESHPHLPHICVHNSLSTAAMCTKSRTFTSVVRAERTAIYTGKFAWLTERFTGLSPVSTVPIITTTTYI